MDISAWNKNYSHTAPIGYILREKFNNRWLRIHSLPNSKRYADNPQEEVEVQNRALKAAKQVLILKNIYLFVSEYSNDKTSLMKEYSCLKSLKFLYFSSHDASEEDHESYFLNTFVTFFKWNENIFKDIILSVAKEEISHILFYSEQTGEAFAPYDGGVDLFYQDEKKRQKGREIFKNWLSDRDDGL